MPLTRTAALGAALFLAACNGSNKDTGPVDTGPATSDSETDIPESYEAEFEGGKYKVVSFESYTSAEDGKDLDGDGEADNNTPNALTLVDAFVDVDMTVDGLNGTVAGALAADDLILLMEAQYADSVLSYDILTGTTAGTGAYLPSDDAYDDSGNPLAHMEGFFTSDVAFWAEAERILVGITFFPKDPAFPVPIELVTLEGEINGSVVEGDLYGAIPVDDLRDLLILPLLEEAYPDPKERATYIDLVDGVLELETVADIDLGGGRRGVSCAFHFTASPITW